MKSNRTWFALAVLFSINMMNFFDRQILGTVGEQIRREWGLSDTALGTLGTAFTIIYAIVGLPLGGLADKFSRTRILGIGVFVWSLLTAASGMCRSFGQLFVARLGVGLGEATCAPAASSLIGDTFPSHKRSNALSIFMLGLPIGIALALKVGGRIAKAYGWHTAFYIAALPGIVCAALALMLIEPARGAAEVHDIGASKREGSAIKLVLSIPSMWPIIASGALHNFNMYAIGSFIVPLMMRYHKVDIAEAGGYAMWVYGLSGIPGLVFGGVLADALTKKYAGGRMMLSAVMFFLAAPLTYLALLAEPGASMGYVVPMALGVAAMYVYYSTTYSTIQDLVEPSLRGTAMATYFCAMYLLGASGGPFLLGKLSDHYTIAAAAAAGVTDASQAALEPFRGAGLHQAMFIVPILNLALTLCMFVAARTVPHDIAKMQAWMRDSAKATPPKKDSIPAPVAAQDAVQ
jgi:MFS family permease